MNEEKETKKKCRKYEFTVDPLEKINLHLPAVTGLNGDDACSENGEVPIATLEDVLEKNRKFKLEKLKIEKHKKRKTKRKRKRSSEGEFCQNGALSLENSPSSGNQTVNNFGGETVLYGNERKTSHLGKMDFSKKGARVPDIPSADSLPVYIRTSHKQMI